MTLTEAQENLKRKGYTPVEIDIWTAGYNAVVFPPHSEYRDKLREMVVEGDFDFTKIFEEVEYEGETYADISDKGADALADYFIDLMAQIDERRSADALVAKEAK